MDNNLHLREEAGEVSIMLPSSTQSSIRASYREHEPGRRSRSGSRSKSTKNAKTEEVGSREESEWEEQRPNKFPAKDERDLVLRKVRSVLNKISSVNYSRLTKRWLNLIPNDPVQLMEVIRLVVDKAMDEPMYMQIYARLFSYALSKKTLDIECMLRSNLKVHIHQCLQRLATDMEIAKFDRSMEREASARQKKVKLHRFIAELFLENVCCPKFVAERVTDLVGQGTRSMEDADEPLECLCVLLTFCGAKLEETKGMWLNDILLKVNLREAACSPVISKRIQFMILDLLEMRSKGWEPHNKWWPRNVPLETDSSETPSRDQHGIDLSSVRAPQAGAAKVSELEWRVRPSKRRTKMNVNPIHGILNKVVPESLDAMATSLAKLLPASELNLKAVVDLILSHVSLTPFYTRVYANLLAQTSKAAPQFGKFVGMKLAELVQKNPDSVGLILFFAEWYNLNMVPARRVMEAIEMVMSSGSIESACTFFLLAGKKLDADQSARVWLNAMLTKLENKVVGYGSRLKCLVLEIIDLQSNKWEAVHEFSWITRLLFDESAIKERHVGMQSIINMMDTNPKEGMKLMQSAFGKRPRDVDKFATLAVRWAVEKSNTEVLVSTGRCIKALSSAKLIQPSTLRGLVGDFVKSVTLMRAAEPEAWNHLGVIMGEIYSAA